MIAGKTASGFEFSVEEDALNDMELLDALEEARLSTACSLLLGKEQRGRLYEHLRNEKGRVPVDRVSSELLEIIQAGGRRGKN